MKNEAINDHIFEAVLKEAVKESNRREVAGFQAESEKLDGFECPGLHADRMGILFSLERKRLVRKTILKTAKMVAAVAVISGALLFGALMTSAPVRAAVHDSIVEWFDKYTTFSSVDEGGGDAEISAENSAQASDGRFCPTYLPDGFVESAPMDNGPILASIYVDSAGTEIYFMYAPKNISSLSVDNENAEYSLFEHDGVKYHMFVSTRDEENKIVWEKEGYRFTVNAIIDPDELKKMAFSVQLRE
jgi:hypothetical protein